MWSLVLSHLPFYDQCMARGTESSARAAFVLTHEFIIRRRTTNNGISFASAVCQHVLKPRSQLFALVLQHIPLGGEGAWHLSRGDFDSLQVLDITNCSVTDDAASGLIRKTKDVPVVVLDRNPLGDLAFNALMHKLFHLSTVRDEEFVISVRNLPLMTMARVRMLTWGLIQVKTSHIEAHCTPLGKTIEGIFQQASGEGRVLYGERKSPLKTRPFDPSMFADLPGCSNLKICIPRPPPDPLVAPPSIIPLPLAAAPPDPLAAPPPIIPLPLAAAAPPDPLAAPPSSVRHLPRNRNERRKLPLPHDTTCKSCGFVQG